MHPMLNYILLFSSSASDAQNALSPYNADLKQTPRMYSLVERTLCPLEAVAIVGSHHLGRPYLQKLGSLGEVAWVGPHPGALLWEAVEAGVHPGVGVVSPI